MAHEDEFKYRRESDLTELTHEQLMPVHNEEFKRINKRVYDLEELSERGIGEVSAIKTDLDWIKQQIIASKEQTEAIIKLGSSVEHMTIEIGKLSVQVEKVVSSIGDHENRISGIEKENFEGELKFIKDELVIIKNRPATTALQYVDYIFKAGVVAAFLSFLWYISGGRIGGVE